jgi:hypothetical protein
MSGRLCGKDRVHFAEQAVVTDHETLDFLPEYNAADLVTTQGASGSGVIVVS